MFIMEENKKTENKKADIRIVGVGGGGSNAIETMIKEGIQGVQFIAVNTDNQALERSSAKIKIQLGSKLTKGLGAGANPEIGRRAAVESYEEIVQSLQGADMIFVTAGMGGGTGTGGAPLVAQAAEELGLLTVGIVTKPFIFEGHKRMKQAERGIRDLRNYVDTLIVIPNEKLLRISGNGAPLLETFKITDDVLLKAVKGIAELVSVPGLINLDFADIKTVMKNKGMALMGRGIAEGPDRAEKAIHSAVSSPFLEGVSIKGATGMIVNITADDSLSLKEVHEASSILTQMAEDNGDIIVGTVIDENMGEKLSVTVIATGFKHEEKASSALFPYNPAPKRAEGQPLAHSTDKAENQPLTHSTDKTENQPLTHSTDKAENQPLAHSTDKTEGQPLAHSTDKAENQPLSHSTDKAENQPLAHSIDKTEGQPLAHSTDKTEGEGEDSHTQPIHSENQGLSQQKLSHKTEETARFSPEKAEETKQKAALDSKEKSLAFSDNQHSADCEEENQEQALSKAENSANDSSKNKKELSVKEILLSKMKEYKEAQKKKHSPPADPDHQMSIDWRETQLDEQPSSPFDSSIDFSDDDMI